MDRILKKTNEGLAHGRPLGTIMHMKRWVMNEWHVLLQVIGRPIDQIHSGKLYYEW